MEIRLRDLEALLFTAQNPMTADQIKESLEQFYGDITEKDDLFNKLGALKSRYQDEEVAFQLTEIDGGFSLLTKPELNELLTHVQNNLARKKLSHAALEALSIIVYKSPATKAMVEQIRGVNSDFVIQKLLEKDLIKITGRSEEVGRPLQFGVGDKFMDHFGLSDLNALPKLVEFEVPAEEIGIHSIEIDPENNNAALETLTPEDLEYIAAGFPGNREEE